MQRLSQLGLVFLISVALSGCFANSPTLKVSGDQLAASPASASLTTADPAAAGADLNAEFDSALTLAREWHADAQFYAFTTQFPPTLVAGKAKRVYVFGSPQAQDEWWTIAVNEQTGDKIRSGVPKSDYLGYELQPVALQYWQVNVIEALQTAESNGGRAFREANSGSEITASLAHQGPNNWLWWVVTYRAEETEHRVRIHPTSGKVYDEQGQELGANADILPSDAPGQ